MACEQLSQQVKSLEAEKRDLQAQLHEAAPGAKPGIVAQIKQINKSLQQLKKQLKACLTAAGL
jgi:septal ring factor EnvC (AmiA/AmiB activator)